MTNRVLVLLFIVASVTGCDSDGTKDNSNIELEAHTVMTSSTLSSGKSAARSAKSDGANVFLTPTNVSGEAVSLLFAISGVPDEGIVIFGEARPDIAPANATTFPFDFATQLAIVSTPSFDTSRPGGQSEHMAVIFAYMDFDITVDSQDHVVRVALVSNNGMQQGDKLIQVGSGFQWYDLDTNTLTATRPSNPARITFLETWVDPVRPIMVFYPFNAFMTNPALTLLTSVLTASSGLDIILNYNVQDMVVLEGVASTAGLVAADVIQLLNVKQVVQGLGDSGLEVHAVATLLP